jgi:hypothetical protein
VSCVRQRLESDATGLSNPTNRGWHQRAESSGQPGPGTPVCSLFELVDTVFRVRSSRPDANKDRTGFDEIDHTLPAVALQ